MADLLAGMPINFVGIGIGVVILLVGGLGVILFLTRKQSGIGGKKFPVFVTIYEARAGNIIKDFDQARRVEDSNKGTIIELKNRKKKIPPIPLNYLHTDKRGKSHLNLYTPDNERYYPIKFDFETEAQPSFLEEKEWDIVDYRTAVKLKELYYVPSFLEKWGNVLYLLIFGMVLMIIMYFCSDKCRDEYDNDH